MKDKFILRKYKFNLEDGEVEELLYSIPEIKTAIENFMEEVASDLNSSNEEIIIFNKVNRIGLDKIIEELETWNALLRDVEIAYGFYTHDEGWKIVEKTRKEYEYHPAERRYWVFKGMWKGLQSFKKKEINPKFYHSKRVLELLSQYFKEERI